MVVCKVIAFFLLIVHVLSWDLAHFGIKNYTALHVSLYRSKSFLSIKTHQEGVYPTLIEAKWPDSLFFYQKPELFPLQSLSNKQDCDFLISVITTSVDVLGRIWILDKGSAKCQGKLLIYNLHSNRIVQVFLLNNDVYKLASMVIDQSIFQKYQKAYIGLENHDAIIVCPLKKDKCYVQNFKVISDDPFHNTIESSENLAISNTDNFLFVTSQISKELFVIELKSIQPNNDLINTFYIGEKLGPSKGLMMDEYNLCYYLSRDYAIVCWDIRKPLNAEGHSVVLQSYKKLPNVSQLLLDSQNRGFAVVNAEDDKFSIEPTCIEFK